MEKEAAKSTFPAPSPASFWKDVELWQIVRSESCALQCLQIICRAAIHNGVCLARLWFLLDGSIKQKQVCFSAWGDAHKHSARAIFPCMELKHLFFSNHIFFHFFPCFFSCHLQVLHEPLIDEDPVFIATCTERELRKRKKRKFSLWVRQCSSTGFICQVGFTSSNVFIQSQQALKCISGPKITVTSLGYLAGGCSLNAASDSCGYEMWRTVMTSSWCFACCMI